MAFAEAEARLETAGIAFILYTTASHTGAHPRWRVLCPFSKSIAPGERAQYVDRLNGLLGALARLGHRRHSLSAGRRSRAVEPLAALRESSTMSMSRRRRIALQP
jgi:hypothetical protein